ncbi:FkbM family methyltransferase [Nonlabens xiamenensis]|uniref:FkbM family methyltransferase n=1 Tax=Nonlabens xiamenensis TaxID=2341043 RepID=UPI000F613BFC|nr:FkbM family methyltransferase [Nonlabens xiamenensis]
MWVICAGAKRSGSTLQYNLVSKLVETDNLGIRIPYFKIEDFSKIKNKYSSYSGLKVIKVHSFNDEILRTIVDENAIVFHCYRDVRDVIVSSIKKGWIKQNDDEIENATHTYLNEFYKWVNLPVPIHSRKYEDFTQDYILELKYFESILNINISDPQRIEIADSLGINQIKKTQTELNNENKQEAYGQVFNKETLIHHNHINSGESNQFLTELNEKEIVSIERIAYKYLDRNGYELKWPDLNAFISLSQHGDDYIAWQLLGKKKNGYAVEIGAFDGMHLSNTYSLEKIGWETLNIEPNPIMFQELELNRPDAINVNCAVVESDQNNTITFFAEEIGVLSGCSFDEEDIKRRYANRGLPYEEPKRLEVDAKSFGKILKENPGFPKNIDVVSIDVEGFELEVLKGIDFNEVNISLLIIESNSSEFDQKIFNFFKSRTEFVFIGRNYQNLFFIDKDKIDRSNLRSISNLTYQRATQYHPFNKNMDLDSTPANFEKSKEFLKRQRFFNFFK